jgi:hypothetical protein
LRRAIRAAAVLAALAGTSAASAQAGTPPDPATVTLPDMTPTRDPGVIADGWKHFYFHKAGISYAEAYADIADCYRFLPVRGAIGALPMFAPWSERPGVRIFQPTNNYGVVGAVIGGLVQGPLDRRERQSRLRRCMEPRGYVRYPIPQATWEQLTDNYSARSIALQARAASGPTPDLAPVTR